MKKSIFFVFGASIGFILSGFAATNLSGNGAIILVAAATLFGGIFGSKLASRAKKDIETKRTLGIVKTIIWLLVIAIIVVAVIAFLGLNL